MAKRGSETARLGAQKALEESKAKTLAAEAAAREAQAKVEREAGEAKVREAEAAAKAEAARAESAKEARQVEIAAEKEKREFEAAQKAREESNSAWNKYGELGKTAVGLGGGYAIGKHIAHGMETREATRIAAMKPELKKLAKEAKTALSKPSLVNQIKLQSIAKELDHLKSPTGLAMGAFFLADATASYLMGQQEAGKGHDVAAETLGLLSRTSLAAAGGVVSTRINNRATMASFLPPSDIAMLRSAEIAAKNPLPIPVQKAAAKGAKGAKAPKAPNITKQLNEIHNTVKDLKRAEPLRLNWSSPAATDLQPIEVKAEPVLSGSQALNAETLPPKVETTVAGTSESAVRKMAASKGVAGARTKPAAELLDSLKGMKLTSLEKTALGLGKPKVGGKAGLALALGALGVGLTSSFGEARAQGLSRGEAALEAAKATGRGLKEAVGNMTARDWAETGAEAMVPLPASLAYEGLKAAAPGIREAFARKAEAVKEPYERLQRQLAQRRAGQAVTPSGKPHHVWDWKARQAAAVSRMRNRAGGMPVVRVR